MDMEQELQELLKDDQAKHMFEETITGARNIELLYKHSSSNTDYPEDVKEICMGRALAFTVARYALEDIIGQHKTPPYYFNYDASTFRKFMYHIDKTYIEWLNNAHTNVPEYVLNDALEHMQLFFTLVQYSLLRGMECRVKLDNTLNSAKNKNSNDE